jgi:hypothetical protein
MCLFRIKTKCAVPPNWWQVTSSRVKLCFPIGSACSMSQITRGKLCLPFGSTCQMPQQIKCIRIQVDCRIHSKVPEPNAARFGRPLIVECLFNCQARLHQHQSKIKLSYINRSANVSTKSQDPFLRRQFPEQVKLRFPFGSVCQVTI